MGVAKLQRLAELRGEAAHQDNRFERTYLAMRPWLPEGVRDFLDIGCGRGVIAIWVARHYRTATAHLIDGVDERSHQVWHTDGVPWRDVNIALRAFAKHCPEIAVKAWPPDPALTIPCELIYSNCSWGHHYPIETYLGLVHRSLKPGGTLIVDLRLGAPAEHGQALLDRHFNRAGTIESPGKKYLRTVWRSAA